MATALWSSSERSRNHGTIGFRWGIDWTSSQRKLASQYVFRERADRPQEGWDAPPDPAA
jgi:hypothetical protein